MGFRLSGGIGPLRVSVPLSSRKRRRKPATMRNVRAERAEQDRREDRAAVIHPIIAALRNTNEEVRARYRAGEITSDVVDLAVAKESQILQECEDYLEFRTNVPPQVNLTSGSSFDGVDD